jgi:transposase
MTEPKPTKIGQHYLDLLAKGHTIPEIAEMCGKSIPTVSNTVRYWTDPVYREKRKAYDRANRQNRYANDPEYPELRREYHKKTRDNKKRRELAATK